MIQKKHLKRYVRVKKNACDIFRSFSIYWRAYGGLKEITHSPYLYLSIIISFFMSIFAKPEWSWSNSILNTLPAILGFSFAGLTLLLGLTGSNFIKLIRGDSGDGKPSSLMRIAGTFTHFFTTQVLALIYALFCDATGIEKNFLLRFIGISLFVYSICTLYASSLAVINIINWIDKYSLDEE